MPAKPNPRQHAKSKAVKVCDCVETVNEKLAEYNTELVRELQFDLDAGTAGMSPPFVATRKITALRDGKPAKSVICSYCPFCGKKYPE